MQLHPIDIGIVIAYLVATVAIGTAFQRRATKRLDAYYLAERQATWWMIGLSGCSSYVDIGGTMLIIGLMYYVGIKSVWVIHFAWGFFGMAMFMAFQAKYIRRSGVMTPAEWLETRFGKNKETELLRTLFAGFILLSLILTLIYVAVGTGKFAEEFVPLPRWESTLIVFVVVGIYVTLGGVFGVIWTDLFQTMLIIIGAIGLSIVALQLPNGLPAMAAKIPEWGSLGMSWNLWPEYLATVPDSYHQYFTFGPLMAASMLWLVMKLLTGPLGWDFAFFLTAKSPREASLSAGMWTLGHTVRWLIAGSFLSLGIYFLGTQTAFDAERIMPLVVKNLPIGVSGLMMAILLAALMSTLSAIINVTSNVVLNDFLKRFVAQNMSERSLVHLGMIVSSVVIILGFALSFMYDSIISAWEMLLYVMLTMILAPATFRWHWWRFGTRAFIWSMAASTAVVVAQKLFLDFLPLYGTIVFLMVTCILLTVIITFLTPPADMDTLVRFYAKVRPFGVWKPVREEAERRGLVSLNDPMPRIDVVNAFVAAFFQLCLGIVPFYVFLKEWSQAGLWLGVTLVTTVVLYFTWYKHLPSPEEV
jgi:SSS family solute:Na+ symporter